MLKINNVNKFFNKGKKSEIHVINNINLELEKTGLVALLGPSGSGKTTLLNAIGGLDNIKSGSIYIDDEKISSKSVYKVDRIRNLNIGYIFQDYKLIDDETVFNNVAISLKLIGIKDKKEIKNRVNFVLEKVGIYRFRNRPAGTLSGGERQRVGIARALVKDPKILLSDEPTGNLDSKNSLEIMNIIKAISKNRLVVLVTHERNLAEFFATRIIEIQDGKIIKDYENNHENHLDYQVDSRLYLKDFKNHEILEKDNTKIELFSNEKETINLKIVVKGNNIYINSDNTKLDIISDTSSIEFIDAHYKKIEKQEIDKYNYDFSNIFNENISTKYSSIFNLFSLIGNGFKKVFNFSKLKKILLIGFFLSGVFTMYAVSSMFAALTIREEDFIEINRNYLTAKVSNITVDDYLKYEKHADTNYMLPSNSLVTLPITAEDFYQLTSKVAYIDGSIASKDMINSNDIILGSYSSDISSFILDEMVVKTLLNSESAKMLGLLKPEDLLNRTIAIPMMGDFIITGIVNTGSPSIYMDESLLINALANTANINYQDNEVFYTKDIYEGNNQLYYDYNLVKGNITLKEGKFPEKDYEVIVNISNKYILELNKEIDLKINNHKLKVVGYYESTDDFNYYLVNNNMIKYSLINIANNIVVYSNNKDNTKNYFRENKLNIQDSYDYSKDVYLNQKKDMIRSSLTSALVVLIISLIEIFLMIRSSFLSRIKEIGIYRAIGLKKIDIYKMFVGEIFAITTLANVPAIIIMAYVLNVLSNISLLSGYFIINIPIVLLVIICIYIFNLVIGLLPVFTTIIKTPASILARYDLD